MMHSNKTQHIILCCFVAVLLCALTSCSSTRNVSRSAKQILLEDSAIATGHIGISIYEPATGKYWYNYNAEKNFIPASNTKLFTLYAGMKYLGDSLVGLRYEYTADSNISLYPTGDPTFLHPDFKIQPVLDFLVGKKTSFYIKLAEKWKSDAFGNGWAWNDYEEDYMAERSPFPLYGNVARIKYSNIRIDSPYATFTWDCRPFYFNNRITRMNSLSSEQRAMKMTDSAVKKALMSFDIGRGLGSSDFDIIPSEYLFTRKDIPFNTYAGKTALSILNSSFNIRIYEAGISERPQGSDIIISKLYSIRSQPTDSFFTPMMHRSDNFFAEQTLMMVSNEKLGYMSDAKIIDTILKTDLASVPYKPRWVDGSGLSRYNLFTPKSFIYILDKMKNEFGMDRLKVILATGGTGTLSNYYKKDSGYIFAKTGTLSNNCALSGFLFTRSGKLLIFSVLANNYQSGATPVRRAVERFLEGIREKY